MRGAYQTERWHGRVGDLVRLLAGRYYGLTLDAIAEEMGVSWRQACRDVREAERLGHRVTREWRDSRTMVLRLAAAR